MNYIQLIIISLAIASISWTISKSDIFNSLRIFICKHSVFWGKLLSCPYCVSHWVAFIFMIHLCGFNFDFIIMSFASITLSTIWVGFINRALDFL
jgi:hypothetical protein